MRLLVDQNLSVQLAAHLVMAGHQAEHTSAVGLGRALDTEIFDWCRQHEAVLLTADKRLTKYLAEQRATSPSVVIFRGYLLAFDRLLDDFLQAAEAIESTVVNEGPAVFSMSPDRPVRAQLLPLVSYAG